MRKIFPLLLLLTLLTSCNTFHKVDFIVDNYGIEYLDSIHKTDKNITLQYPADAFRVARPYLMKYFGRKYTSYKPYRIEIVDDSLWGIRPFPDLKWLLTDHGRDRFNGHRIYISMHDGKIKFYKNVRL